MKKKYVICSAVLLLVCVVLYFIPIRWKVEMVLPAQLVENLNTEEGQETEIAVEGDYYFYLFRPDRFEGKLELSKFPETVGKSVEFEVSNEVDELVYRTWQGQKLNSESFGLIQADFGMKQMVIFVNEENGVDLTGNQGRVILSEGWNAKDAKEVLKEITQE